MQMWRGAPVVVIAREGDREGDRCLPMLGDESGEYSSSPL